MAEKAIAERGRCASLSSLRGARGTEGICEYEGYDFLGP
jgi:hypothetical protein